MTKNSLHSSPFTLHSFFSGTPIVTDRVSGANRYTEMNRNNQPLTSTAMKKIVFALAILVSSTLGAEAHRFHYTAPGRISIQTFYDELAPYGEWINTPEYGFAWRPYTDVSDDFTPYSTGGNWAYTGLGWTWVSDYPWGWATFHYGRWYYDDYLGWMWVPGYEWAPAWVTWGSYDDYWAWAPMAPGFGVNVNIHAYPPDFWWVFVPRRNFCDHNWHAHIWRHHDRPVIVNNITIINPTWDGRRGDHRNGSWNQGPRVNEVERHAGTRVRRMEVRDAERPGTTAVRSNRVEVYRPEINREAANTRPGSYRSPEEARKEVRTTPTVRQENINRNQAPGTVTRENLGSDNRINPPTGVRNEIGRGQSVPPPETIRNGENTRKENRTEVRSEPENRRDNPAPVIRDNRRNTERNTSTGTEVRTRSQAGSPTRTAPEEKKKDRSASSRTSGRQDGERK